MFMIFYGWLLYLLERGCYEILLWKVRVVLKVNSFSDLRIEKYIVKLVYYFFCFLVVLIDFEFNDMVVDFNICCVRFMFGILS